MPISTADAIMNKVKAINSTDDSDVKSSRNKATAAGAVVGVFAGMYYGYTRKKNVFVMGAVGAAIGALMTRAFLPKK